MTAAFVCARRALVFAFFGATLLWCSTLPAASPATITVQADKPGAAVSPALWGLFFEEINHAGDGGLYAEMIRNRSFEETLPVEGCTFDGEVCRGPATPNSATGKVKGWSVPWKFDSPWPAWSLDNERAAASMSLESNRPLHPSNVRYLRLKIDRLPADGAVRLLNDGYWGVAVAAGKNYDFSCYLRTGKDFSGGLRVGIVGCDGQLLASAALSNLSGEKWKKHACTITARGADKQAKFFLQPLGTGTLDVDVVSLFPRETFKNRPNGCRPDLANLLAGLKPAFLRFPGGCVVEGATMANRYRWKETIGDVSTRPGHWSLWNYRNVDGLGHHEFLQLCEDLGCAGMYVCNCGLSCPGRNGDYWPDERIDESIQDCLDAVEYALGGAETKWGALRVKAGHPAPLPLKYVEIGNENFGPRYESYYRRFAAALKKSWPQLTLICDTGFKEADVHDQHFYVEPEFFFDNFRMYDRRPEPGAAPPKVYVGEYAVNRNVGAGNLRGALAEAAFMMGMERNSDYVIMASYAPLFYHVNDRKWPVNLIGFDNTRSFGRTSYYVQQMFAAHRPDVTLACTSTAPPLELPGRAGAIGVGTWATQAEFKDVTVTQDGRTLFASDFTKGRTGWRTTDGKWETVDGALRQTGNDHGARALIGDNAWRDYTLSLKARKLGGAEGFLIMFQAARSKDKCWWNLGGWGNREHGLEVPGVIAPRVPGKIETGRWYDIRVELRGPHIRCYLDGKLVHDASGKPLDSIYAAAGRVNGSGEIIVKAVNAASIEQAVEVRLEGVGQLQPQGKAIILAHADPTAENSVDEPRKVAPVEQEFFVPGPTFTRALPANSLTILRLKPAAFKLP